MNKNCSQCAHSQGYVSDGFYNCEFRGSTLPFVQFNPTDCDQFSPKKVKDNSSSSSVKE
jgi:hypothetical protein